MSTLSWCPTLGGNRPVATTIKDLGEEQGQAWLANLRPICPQMARVFITPEWVGILDFESRFPSAIERAMAGASS